MIGAEVYVNGNVGTGSVQEMAEWVEYMTADNNSTLAQLRRDEEELGVVPSRADQGT